jgi:hypothetical protein
MDGDVYAMPAGAGFTWKTGGGLVLTSTTRQLRFRRE